MTITRAASVPEGQVLAGHEVAEHAARLDQAAVIRLPAVGELLQVLDLKRSVGVFDRDRQEAPAAARRRSWAATAVGPG